MKKLLLIFGFVVSSFAEVESVDLDSIDSARMDFDPISFAIMAANLNAAAASSGNITNDVAWIRDFLSAVQSSATSYRRIRTEPYISSSTANVNLGTFLNRLLAERGDANLASPNQTYLYQIRDLLRVLTNDTSSVQLDGILSYVDDLESSLNSLVSTAYNNSGYLSSLNSYSSIYMPLLNSNLSYLVDYLAEFEYSQGWWGVHLDDNQFSDLLANIRSVEDEIRNSNTWTNELGDIGDILEDLETLLTDFQDSIVAEIDENTEVLQDISLDVSHIDEDFHTLLNWTTNAEVVAGFDASAGITNAPSPTQLQAEMSGSAEVAEAESIEADTLDSLSDYVDSISSAMPQFEFSSMIPGDVSPISGLAPNFAAPEFVGDSGIPILSQSIDAGSITIPAFSLDLGTGSPYRSVIDDFSAKVGPSVRGIWTLAFAVSLLLLAKYEWHMYMCGFVTNGGSVHYDDRVEGSLFSLGK